jgi:hypothetical protein
MRFAPDRFAREVASAFAETVALHETGNFSGPAFTGVAAE